MGKRTYIVSPHDDMRNMFRNAKGMTVHRWGHGKRRVDPVFKNHRQRIDFKKITVQERRALRLQIRNNPWGGAGQDPRLRQLRAINKLNKMSQPGRAFVGFGNVPGRRPKVYVQGHGAPGSQNISDDAHNAVSAQQTAVTLKGMQLPQQAKLRANSCYSGTTVAIGGVAATNALQQHQTVQGLIGPPGNTFAGGLAHQMRNVAPTFPNIEVGGYPGPTTQNPVGGLVDRQLNPVPGTGIRVRFGNIGTPTMLGVKRGETRIQF
ncbi:hypothetical protein KK141_11835 [Dyella sp. LX-66]|uniref:hypothetical protein n=1 Tax=unclassified Dyella TaxID=2634549 RepID=UPI001BDF8610|nr:MULTISPECIES: hypothetical protein [unclassified Dyella]MBT2118339.1 hypothetical protein [Dyella sp. LX-1]MBT2140222.1 hypothetical protein [Dyella sp. LX-66]